ncbi:MAG: TniB family NTP-binding protein [Janthinobacterium lividum]
MHHLAPDTVKLLNLPTYERRNAILTDKWIAYSQAQQVTQQLTNLLNHPRIHRMPNLLVVADANNGKTTILRRFATSNGSSWRQQDEQLICPVLYLHTPIELDERQFYRAILDQTNTPYCLADRVGQMQRKVMQVLRQAEVRLLIVDDIQNLLVGNEHKQRSFLHALKHLSIELMLSLVASGTSAAIRSIERDEQLAYRFGLAELPRWTMGEEYLSMLSRFEQLIPLYKASNLVENGLAYKILIMSEGLLGELARILKLAAVEAIDGRVECITQGVLDSLDYLPPSRRGAY